MFLVGQRVQITPKTAEARKFWEYVDGRTGNVEGVNNGLIIVKSGEQTFFVEPENLTHA